MINPRSHMGLPCGVVTEARNYEDANNRLDDITSGYSRYCDCCSERWSEFYDEPENDYSFKFDNLDDVKNYLKDYFETVKQKDPKAFLHDYYNNISELKVEV